MKIIFGLLSLYLVNQINADSLTCDVSTKAECGYYGIGETECVRTKGCCWEESDVEGAPWCFFKEDTSLMCQPDSARLECGWFGIDQEKCEESGCCWSPLEEGDEQPWCFYKVRQEGVACAAHEERVDCGWGCITPDVCVNENECCFSPTTDYSPWCYEPTKFEAAA